MTSKKNNRKTTLLCSGLFCGIDLFCFMNIVEDSVLIGSSQLSKDLIKKKRIIYIGVNFSVGLVSFLLGFGFDRITFFILKKDEENVEEINVTDGYDVFFVSTVIEVEKEVSLIAKEKPLAINDLDGFTENVFLFDDLCSSNNILVLHFYGFKKTSIAILIEPKSVALKTIVKADCIGGLALIKYITGYMGFWGVSHPELELTLLDLKKEEQGFLLNDGKSKTLFLVYVLFEVVVNNKAKAFPEFYISLEK